MRPLSSGGQAQVDLFIEKKSNKKVAVKTYDFNRLGSGEDNSNLSALNKMVRTEVKILSKLKGNSSIVGLEQAYRISPSEVRMVFSYAEFGSLEDFIASEEWKAVPYE